ncbi:MAG: hypothetical protein KatS3mg105_0255 [Gemmatales bacterium]|nr:MAG: hypothetical protein KatS3mg105_0255 [Gemmatales bacterium]
MLDFSTLTDRQREIYEFIKQKIEERGYGPTVREIGESRVPPIRSPNGVMCHLRALETKGFIKRAGKQARAIELVHYKPGSAGLPLLGDVAAGHPIDAPAQSERLEFNELFGHPENFALRVRGNSMIESHIIDGDYVVIRRRETAENGQRVVVMVDNEVTLKRFYKTGDEIRLEPDNGKMKPIRLDATKNVPHPGRTSRRLAKILTSVGSRQEKVAKSTAARKLQGHSARQRADSVGFAVRRVPFARRAYPVVAW